VDTFALKAPKATDDIRTVAYRVRKSYELDMEIIPADALRRRVPQDVLRKPERIGFYMFIFVTSGDFHHLVDSEHYRCDAGTSLLIRPGQIQQYDMDHDWTGWIVMFRPQFLLPDEGSTPLNEMAVMRHLDTLPAHLKLEPVELEAVTEVVQRLHADAMVFSPRVERHALMRVQFQALLVRLHLIQRHQAIEPPKTIKTDRFALFRDAVEANFHRTRSVRDFARQLQCSERSLNRAAFASVGMTAKSFLMQRILLEAKRLLIYSALSISEISYQLGFDEPTNFGKFFSHDVGESPSAFRRRHQSTLL
jgi:AraC-like DNA-binding protein